MNEEEQTQTNTQTEQPAQQAKKKKAVLIGIPEIIIIAVLFFACITMRMFVADIRQLSTQDIYYVSDVDTPTLKNVTYEQNGDTYTVKLLNMFPIGETTIKHVLRPQVYLGKEGIMLGGKANLRVVNGFCEETYAEDAGLQIGDEITHVNGVAVNDDTFSEAVAASPEMCNIQVLRDGKTVDLTIRLNSSHMLGIYVGGSTQTILGTMTFVTQDGHFCAIGHEVEGSSALYTEAYQVYLQQNSDGEMIATQLISDNAGELKGYDAYGANGIVATDWLYGDLVEIGYSWEINMDSPVEIYLATETEPKLANLSKSTTQTLFALEDGTQIPVYPCTLVDGADFAYGMSGSPVMQNGRLVGVLMALNKDDATQGYFLPVDRLYEHFIGFEDMM